MVAAVFKEPTYRLVKVFDLREWDEAAEGYLDIDDEHKNQCHKCGKLHAKVYRVLRLQDGQEFDIGSGCARKHLDGWQPEQEEVKRLEKEATREAKAKGYQKLVALALPIAQEVAALPLPEIVSLGTKYISQVPIYGFVGSSVQVCCREGLTEERRHCCIENWKREQVMRRLETVLPRTSTLNSEDVNFKKRSKIEQIVRKELGIW